MAHSPNPYTKYHLFLSYARRDNESPVNAEGEGWVTAFARELKRRHRRYSGRELEVFFDKESIREGEDWRRRLGAGLRDSRLFLAFLSPNYLVSRNCIWEWEEYLRREHSRACGDDGVTPIYFVTPADLRLREDQELAAWLREMETKYPWFRAQPPGAPTGLERGLRPLVKDLHRRQKSEVCELQSWFANGPEILKELDAAERSAAVKSQGRDVAGDTRSLAERLEALDRHIARRLDRVALADLAPGNVERGYATFVGRHAELRQLHDIMVTGGRQSGGHGSGGRGMIAATHSPGGLGKTALARQYAHAYADFYAAGGIWEIPCEGMRELGQALLRLADDRRFQRLGQEIGQEFELSEAQRGDFHLAVGAILDYLERATLKRADRVREELCRHPDRHSPEDALPRLDQPRALLILDNVDQPELLSASEAALLPAVDWLEIIVTTRLDAAGFGAGARWTTAVEIHPLPDADALELLREFQPNQEFPNETEERAAEKLVASLFGYTLAVELVAAYLGVYAADGFLPSDFLRRFDERGFLEALERLSEEAPIAEKIRHGETKIGPLLDWSIERLSRPAKWALELASLLMPEAIPMPWLEALTRARFPEELKDEPGFPSRWAGVWRELYGLRLLSAADGARSPARIPEVARIHRLVAQHVASKAPEPDTLRADIERFLDVRTTEFERLVGWGADHQQRCEHPQLLRQFEYILDNPYGSWALSPRLFRSAKVSAYHESEHGSLVRAIPILERILAAEEVILSADPTSAVANRDVSVSLNKLGDCLVNLDRKAESSRALDYFERSVKLSEGVFRVESNSEQVVRDLNASLSSLGRFLIHRKEKGDVAQALENFRRMMRLTEELLAKGEPESGQVVRDLLVAVINIGDIYKDRGGVSNFEAALQYYDRGLKVAELFVKSNSGSFQVKIDVAACRLRIGEVYVFWGDPGIVGQAIHHYEQAVFAARDALEMDPGSVLAKSSLVMGLELLACEVNRQLGEGRRALGLQKEAFNIASEICETNQGVISHRRRQALSSFFTGEYLYGLGERDKADDSYRIAFQILGELVAARVMLDEQTQDLYSKLKNYFAC